MPEISPARRPLKTRHSAWAEALARRLADAGLSPNAISMASLLFALAGASAMLAAGAWGSGIPPGIPLVAAAICIQLRLLCNLLDGMVAIEGGRATRAGAVFNELPDRLADPLLIVPAGYVTGFDWGPELAWTAGLLALLTAYVRTLGTSLGLEADFRGPMAKPHRMAAMTVGLLIAALLSPLGWSGEVLLATLGILVLGSGVTVVRRSRTLLRALEAGPAEGTR